MDMHERYTQASVKTASDLRTIARSSVVRDLSRLTLPQIDAAVDLVARLVPAGNVPGMILNGLARLAGRRLPPSATRQNINLLFQGVEQVLDRAVYATFFAGPAAVIYGYQQLLKLAGKDPEDSFPDGTWQFYVEYALREDSARHANETHGFDTVLRQHQIQLSPVDRAAAWAMAAIHCLHQYDELLENEWRERVYTRLLREVTGDLPDAGRCAQLYREWTRQRPYGRGRDCAANETYPSYRRHKFDQFLEQARGNLSMDQRRQWADKVRSAERDDLPAYQRQMTMRAYLEAGPYNETRTPLPVENTHVGLIYQGRYHLLPICTPGTDQPADVLAVRAQIAALMAHGPATPPATLASWTQVKRATWPRLRDQLNAPLVESLANLQFAPILLNVDPRPGHLPLAELRQAERGIGDHPLTILDTGGSFVFDQSHIFFDGAWGSALAEILTNEALSWAVYLQRLPPAQPGATRPYALAFPMSPDELALLEQTPRIRVQVSAESGAAQIKAILALRKLFKQRSDLLQLTVNDLLILYRAIHAATYQPDPDLVGRLEALAQVSRSRPAATAALEEIDRSGQVNPAILIPIDASPYSPRERLYPLSFEVPLGDLDLLNLQRRVVAALDAYEQAVGDRTAQYAEFDQLQRTYLAALAGFGAVLRKAKEMGTMGESASVGAIKLLAHMPAPLQRLLDMIPGRFEILNDIIKGREVFSNVGAVVASSTLTRFATAIDDNEKKTLAWGVITDADKVMRISLRDFRPHVGMLVQIGHEELAQRITQDYVDSYARGLNRFVRDLQRITLASRETQAKAKRPPGH